MSPIAPPTIGLRPFLLRIQTLLVGCAGGDPTDSASTSSFGGFTLAPHEMRSIQIRSANRGNGIRLCNNSGSAGPLDATIGDRNPIVLQPGECTRDYGDRIALSNASAGTVSGNFRALSEPKEGKQK